jgi:hypothetical protein
MLIFNPRTNRYSIPPEDGKGEGSALSNGDAVALQQKMFGSTMWLHGRIGHQDGKYVFLWLNVDDTAKPFAVKLDVEMVLRRM